MVGIEGGRWWKWDRLREEREREIRDHAILSSRLSIPLVISSNMIDPLTQTHRSPNFVRRKSEQ